MPKTPKSPPKKIMPPDTASKLAETTKELLASRKTRDKAVNNTRTGFSAGSPDKELDKDQYANTTGRRPKR